MVTFSLDKNMPNGQLDFENLFKDLPGYWRQQAEKNYPRDALIKAKRQCAASGLASFSDVVYWSHKLVSDKTYSDIVNALRHKYCYWIIDEAQDTSQLHALIMRNLWGDENGSEILIVGDPDQAIYEWNKAIPEFLLNIISENKVWKQLRLTENWRSSQAICNATHPFRNPIISYSPAIAKGSDASIPINPVILLFSVSAHHLLPAALLKIWRSKITNSSPNPDLAVVAWKNETIGKILGRESGSLPTREISRHICNVVFLYKRGEETKSHQLLEQTICQLLFDRPSLGVDHRLLPSTVSYSKWCKWLSSMLMRLVALFDDKITVNQFVKKSREIVQEAFKEYSWITYAKLGQKICVTSTDEAEQQLLSFFDNRLDTNGITVGTIHSKKGATVDGIMVVGDYDVDTQTTDVSEWLKSAHPSTGLCDEPKRIAYVAMTRPRKLLVVAIPYECGNNLIYHSDWKKGGFEYLQLEDVVSTNEKK